MKESINREDYDVSSRVSINLDTVQNCIDDLINNSIDNREEFYNQCVLERFDKCNANYVKDFDQSLDNLIDNMFDSEGEFNYYEFKKLLRSSMKLTSDIYSRYVDLICRLMQEGESHE